MRTQQGHKVAIELAEYTVPGYPDPFFYLHVDGTEGGDCVVLSVAELRAHSSEITSALAMIDDCSTHAQASDHEASDLLRVASFFPDDVDRDRAVELAGRCMEHVRR